MDYTTLEYKGFEIEVNYEEGCSINPFEDWDYEFPIMVHNSSYDKDYSKGEIHSYLGDYLTLNQIKRNQKKILGLFEPYYSLSDFNLDYPLGEYTGDDRAEILQEKLQEWQSESVENLIAFCEVFDIMHYNGITRGYSQGDYAEVFVCPTPEYFKRVGTNPKDVKESWFEDTVKLYGHWAWGDVFWYNIEEVNDSCGGFYGDDFESNGLLEYARNAIDCHIEAEKEKERKEELKRQQKLKEYIKNNVPLNYRVFK